VLLRVPIKSAATTASRICCVMYHLTRSGRCLKRNLVVHTTTSPCADQECSNYRKTNILQTANPCKTEKMYGTQSWYQCCWLSMRPLEMQQLQRQRRCSMVKCTRVCIVTPSYAVYFYQAQSRLSNADSSLSATLFSQSPASRANGLNAP
jgi:hypothetical protein